MRYLELLERLRAQLDKWHTDYLVWLGFLSPCCRAEIWVWSWNKQYCTVCEKEV